MNIAPGSKIRRVVQEHLSPNPKPTALQLTEDSDDQDSRGLLIRFFKISSGGTVPVTRADKIPRPSKWTTHEFANYVEKLTSIHMPNHVHHLLYRKGEQHVKTVVGILREIFTDPECKSSLSRMAFKMALDYFVKTSNIADARAIFVLMDMMEIEMDPGIFNILLRGAAKNDDLHNFQLVLHLMLRRGISPNGRTWTAFLMANHDFRIKRYIMSEMKAKGLLAHPYIMRRVCQEFVIQEVNASVDLGLSQEDFLNHMDSQYGNNWLTADNGNRVLHALGARGLISRCWEFLQAMNNRSVRIESVSVNTVLNHCKQQTNISGAIEIMRLLPSLTEFEPDQFTYHTLFEMAWRARRYNIARVVWKYACLNAATTRRMRVLVTQSLIYAAQNPGPKSSEMQIWNQQAGLVITHGVFDHPSPNWDGPSYGQRFVLHPEKNVSRKEIFEAASRHVERDFEVFNSWAPRQPFGDILVQALELDLRWHETRVRTGEEARFDWKIEEAIVVPLYKLEGVGKGKIRMDWR
jgi:pentatricopeptide repeat protein